VSLRANLRVRRGDFALDADFAAADGETVAVLGPNGAGKTTLLRALAGLQPLDAGSISLGSTVLEDVEAGIRVPARSRRTAVVFQDYRLFPHLTARENVAFGLRARGTPARSARARADDLLGQLGLAGLEQRRPADLSGGQAQRVSLARALATGPELLLLDEPLAALDFEVRGQLRSMLRDGIASFAGPTVLITHDPLEALTLADRMVVLEHGTVVQQGRPAEIARRPATTYVARLVGLNLYRGRLDAGQLHVEGGGVIVCASGDRRGDVAATIRPSAVTLFIDPPSRASARNVWQGRIASLEPSGERVRVAINSTFPIVAEVTTAALAELRLGPGDQIWAMVKATDVDVQT
jgi:molybdate transport system ATP-binding protein